MAFSPTQLFYRTFGNRLPAVEKPMDLPTKSPIGRPTGQLIWLHVPDVGDHPVALELISTIGDDHPDCWFLMTTEGKPIHSLPDQVIFQIILSDRPAHAQAFLTQWKPDLVIWLSNHLLPTHIGDAAKMNIPLILLDTGSAFRTTKKKWPLPRLTRLTLRKFDTLLSSDEATSLALISAGAKRENVHTSGALELSVSPPKCNDAEWGILAAMIATRPIWLATIIELDTFQSILAAHIQATRRAHRLLLIIVPANPDDFSKFRSILKAQKFSYAIRSENQEPDHGIQIYLADTEDEVGLWYRLAPVCFIGQSKTGTNPPGSNPLEAACLGSVVMHVPGPGPHEVAFQRLERAGASKPIPHLGELAHGLETVLAPDRAAVMAHAAWQITSAGAEAMDTATTRVTEYLDAPPGSVK